MFKHREAPRFQSRHIKFHTSLILLNIDRFFTKKWSLIVLSLHTHFSMPFFERYRSFFRWNNIWYETTEKNCINFVQKNRNGKKWSLIIMHLDPSIELKRFFGPKTGDPQKKGLYQNSNGFSGQKQGTSKKNANTTFSNQNALWPIAKYFCGPPVGHDPQVENHRIRWNDNACDPCSFVFA